MTRREWLSDIGTGLAGGLVIGGALAGLFDLARRQLDRAGRWMPRDIAAEREAAVRELRFALRDPDQMHSMRAVHRLRELTGSRREWNLATSRAVDLAIMDAPQGPAGA